MDGEKKSELNLWENPRGATIIKKLKKRKEKQKVMVEYKYVTIHTSLLQQKS